MGEVVWSGRAIAELEAIAAYIDDFSPLAAQRLAARIISAAQSLDQNALRGRPLGDGRRELTQIRPYLIRYEVEDGCVVVLEVRHGARAPD